jgi:hypothetical protein
MGSPTTYGSYKPLKNPIAINQTTGQRTTLPAAGAPPAPGAPAAPGGGGNDYTNAAMKRLQSIASGQDVPLDEATKANMLSKSQEGAAAAEQAQNQSLMEGAAAGGASPNDPSLQGAKRQNMAARQGANQQASRDIELETRRQNFAASQGAAESLAGFGQAQQRIDQNDPNNPANAQMISNPFPGGASSGGSPLGFQYGGGGGGVSTVNQAAQNRLAQPAPQQSAAQKLAATNRTSGLASVRQQQNALDRGGTSITQQNRDKQAANALAAKNKTLGRPSDGYYEMS